MRRCSRPWELPKGARRLSCPGKSQQGFGERLLEAAYRPVAPASLAVFRIALGAILCWEAVRFFTNGWIEKTYLAPVMPFTYGGLEWGHPWPGSGRDVQFIVLAIAALMVMGGWRYRFAMSVLF